MRPVVITKTLAAANAANVAASQSPAAGAILINGSAASGGVATLDTQRRIIVTSGGNDTGITFTIFGTNQAGAAIQETVTGASGAASLPTNQDFLTVTAVTHTGSVASTVTVGTSGVGSTPWLLVDPHVTPTMLGAAVVVSGTVNYTVEYTYDDFLNLAAGVSPTVFTAQTPTVLKAAAINGDGVLSFTFRGLRLTINSNTPPGAATLTAIQSGIRQ
jgi:hypothetical protein